MGVLARGPASLCRERGTERPDPPGVAAAPRPLAQKRPARRGVQARARAVTWAGAIVGCDGASRAVEGLTGDLRLARAELADGLRVTPLRRTGRNRDCEVRERVALLRSRLGRHEACGDLVGEV